MDAIMPIVTFFQERPLFFFALLFFIYNKWKGSQPWPDYGGNITKVHNLQEWDSLLKSSGSSKVVVVDAYALWCPPCKSAAPVYAKLSEEFSEETCCFAKIDVDHAKDVAQRLHPMGRQQVTRSFKPCRSRGCTEKGVVEAVLHPRPVGECLWVCLCRLMFRM